jgi:hypothetical protein
VASTPSVVEAVQVTVVKIEEATTAIVAAQTAVDSAAVAVQAVDTQTAVVTQAVTNVDSATAVVATATTNLSNAQADLTTAQTTATTAQAAADASGVITTAPGLVVKVYNVQGQNNAPVIPQGATPIHTAVDTTGINENWGSGNVAGSNRSEDVIVTYEGQVTAPEGVNTIRFIVLSDDGARIYIDSQLVVDNWRDQGPTWSFPSQWIDFTNDRTKDIAVWYYENGGGATLHLGWQHSGIHTGVGVEYLSHTTTTQDPTLVVAASTAVAAVPVAEAVVTDKTQVKEVAETVLASAQSTLTTETQTLDNLQSTASTAITNANDLANTAVIKANEAKVALETATTTVSIAVSQYAAAQLQLQAQRDAEAAAFSRDAKFSL